MAKFSNVIDINRSIDGFSCRAWAIYEESDDCWNIEVTDHFGKKEIRRGSRDAWADIADMLELAVQESRKQFAKR